MERSTPINHLHRSGGDQDPAAAEMMDHIVDDLEAEQQQHSSGTRESFNPGPPGYAGPPPQQQRQYPGPPDGGQYAPPQRMPQGPMRGGNYSPSSLENASLGQRLMTEAKEPLLVSVLVMLMSSNQLQSLIARFLPIAASNPLIGLAVRALAAGVLFYLLRRFIPSA